MCALILDSLADLAHTGYMATVVDTVLLEAIELRLVSPIRYVREMKNLSIRDAADLIGCHHQALYMNEIGCYPHVLPVVMAWLTEGSDYDQSQFSHAYERYQEVVRKQTADLFAWREVKIEHLGVPGDNPIIKLREHFDMSRAGLAKRLCLPTAMLYSAENPDASNLVASVPEELLRLLALAGLPEDVQQEMVDRYEMWYEGV
jgi:hypothetical protein